jgi:hypothetical protein
MHFISTAQSCSTDRENKREIILKRNNKIKIIFNKTSIVYNIRKKNYSISISNYCIENYYLQEANLELEN